jgi:hypothetical protein
VEVRVVAVVHVRLEAEEANRHLVAEVELVELVELVGSFPSMQRK